MDSRPAPSGASRNNEDGVSRRQSSLAVVDQDPADGGKANNDGRCNRPAANTDSTDGLPQGFIPGDLAISCLGVVVAIAHRPLPDIHADLTLPTLAT